MPISPELTTLMGSSRDKATPAVEKVKPGFKGIGRELLEVMGLEEMSEANLMQLREQYSGDQTAQNILGPMEHRAFLRETIAENPLSAGAWSVIHPIYTGSKFTGIRSGRSRAYGDEVIEGYKGIGEGLLLAAGSKKPLVEHIKIAAVKLGRGVSMIGQELRNILDPKETFLSNTASGKITSPPLPSSYKPNKKGVIDYNIGKTFDWSTRLGLPKIEKEYGLPKGLAMAQIHQESRGDPGATSNAGAKGLFQFMDSSITEAKLKPEDAYTPGKMAIPYAEKMSKLLKKYNGNLNKALAAYNLGVTKFNRDYKGELTNLPKETREYIAGVNKYRKENDSTPKTK